MLSTVVPCAFAEGETGDTPAVTYDLSGVSFSDTTVTYDGTEHSIFIEGDLPEGVTVSYEGNGQTNAGVYEVTAVFATAEGDASLPSMTALLTINRASFDMSGVTFEDAKIIMDGEEHSIFIQGDLPEGVSVTYTGNGQSTRGRHPVTATFIVDDPANWNIPAPMTAMLILVLGPVDVTFDVSGIEGLGGYASVDGVRVGMSVDAETGMARVRVEDEGSRIITAYAYNTVSDDVHTVYPVHMYVWFIDFDEETQSLTVTRVPEMDDLFQYAGSSIRMVGVKGIRMITGIPQSLRSGLISGSVTFGGKAWKLMEYGTTVGFDSELAGADVTYDNTRFHNYAYKRGVADPIFSSSNGLVRYTNVLTGFTMEQCAEDLAMRPYLFLQAGDGERITIYGGTVHRSIGYIAYQNRDAYAPATDAYEYIWAIIHAVYGDVYDDDYAPGFSDEEYWQRFTPVVRIAVASDVHIDDSGTEMEEARLAGLFSLAYGVAQADSSYSGLDGVALVGDLTDRGTEYSFMKVDSIVDVNIHAGTRRLFTMGNHDFYAAPGSAMSTYKSVFGMGTDFHVIINGYHFIGLTPGTRGISYSSFDVTWLSQQLAEAAADTP
ncbi:MAG: metallophosphoesterase, partial [Eggerthellaceae bacterium]|nr:metallophosphoesterase [Eggerthellaceae bacterium]